MGTYTEIFKKIGNLDSLLEKKTTKGLGLDNASKNELNKAILDKAEEIFNLKPDLTQLGDREKFLQAVEAYFKLDKSDRIKVFFHFDKDVNSGVVFLENLKTEGRAKYKNELEDLINQLITSVSKKSYNESLDQEKETFKKLYSLVDDTDKKKFKTTDIEQMKKEEKVIDERVTEISPKF